MTPKLSQHLNKTILVSIPALFDDGKCRMFTLVGVELHGLWLQSDEFAARLLHERLQPYAAAAPVTFVPFAQIAGVLVPTQAPAPRPAAAAAAAASKKPAATAAKPASSVSNHKTSPGRRR